MHKRRSELSPAAQTGISILGAVQLALAAAAWTDLARRPDDEVSGRKSWWAAAILVNFVGPIAYFRLGRRGSSEATSG
ncbi:PLDc N-terminal domain-containing protein [Antrihabitans sp. YC2-6]|uniref:PLDc N-terminal domain-containing protein n=1 Tax=Antrihabitans sp. YC2-6 TaxID=2799498 RepID=UPI0018F6CE01|nr:PLD nuclease N-terminal domain-containing protein [Antrihabitans sp. YC2-6]MBJ8347041.1 PLDc_N domain-containing protein [Antrihabitans sp. YC2-6]